jgi:hypothetical protein
MSIFLVKATPASNVTASGTITFSYPLNPIAGNPSYPYPFEPAHLNANPPPVQPVEQMAAGDFTTSVQARAYATGMQAVLVEGIHFTLTYNTPIASGITMTMASTFTGTIPAGTLVTLQLTTFGQADGTPFKSDSRISRGNLSPVAIIRMGSPLAASATAVQAAIAVPDALLHVLSVPANGVLDVPRNLQFVSSNAGDTTQTITVRGFDEYGNAMTETKTLNGTTIVAGLKAFKTVISYQASASLAGNLSIGSNTALGLPIPLNVTGYVVQEITDGAKSGTFGTYVAAVDNALMTATTGDVRGTVIFNTAPNGTHSYEVMILCPDPAYQALPQYAG